MVDLWKETRPSAIGLNTPQIGLQRLVMFSSKKNPSEQTRPPLEEFGLGVVWNEVFMVLEVSMVPLVSEVFMVLEIDVGRDELPSTNH